MYKLWVIAHREYVAMVGTKAFVFTLVMMPILMFGSFLVMPLLSRVTGGKTLHILVADPTGQVLPTLLEANEKRNEALRLLEQEQSKNHSSPSSGPKFGKSDDPMNASHDYWEFEAAPAEQLDDELRLELSKRIRHGDIYAVIEIPKSIFASPNHGPDAGPPDKSAMMDERLPTARFVSNDALISTTRGWISHILQAKARGIRIQQTGLENINPAIIEQIDAPVELAPRVPYQASDVGGVHEQSQTDSLFALFLPFGVMMLMFMVILMAAQPMLESAMEEKNLRIAEVLLGSVTATQLMGGKLLGNVAGSLVIFLFYGSGGWFFINLQGMGDKVPVGILPWFFVFQILGVLFFSSIFLTVGASVNELKEAQTLLLPVWLILMAPMMVWFIAIRDPNGIVATTLSFFPPSCPMMMILRLASGTTVPFWQPPLAALMMVVVTTGVVFVAGRIYRVGLLRTDGVRSLVQLFRRSRAVG